MEFSSDAFVKRIATAATKLQWQIMTAESCTGGLIAAALTHPPGSSSWYAGGIVAYHNGIKKSVLGVSSATLAAHGSVSEATVAAMCNGLKSSAADAAVAVTGIAGPSGGSPDKPVGTVCFGVLAEGRQQHLTKHFPGDRAKVRESATLYALALLATALEKAVAQQQQ